MDDHGRISRFLAFDGVPSEPPEGRVVELHRMNLCVGSGVGDLQRDRAASRAEIHHDRWRPDTRGGQGVNTTDSAVRITHLPTGTVVTCQNERSQLQNKQRALEVLAARLQAAAEEAASAEASEGRATQVRTVDRSERIRTYNFPENRIADHRVGFKAHNLDSVLDGDMDAVLDALAVEDRRRRMEEA